MQLLLSVSQKLPSKIWNSFIRREHARKLTDLPLSKSWQLATVLFLVREIIGKKPFNFYWEKKFWTRKHMFSPSALLRVNEKDVNNSTLLSNEGLLDSPITLQVG